MRQILPILTLAALLISPRTILPAGEPPPTQSGPRITITGDTQHSEYSDPVSGAPPDLSSDAFSFEIFGKSFLAAVAGLPPGEYTVQIDLAEQFYWEAGKRIMTIRAGAQTVAEHLDPWKAAGGQNKAYRLTAKLHVNADGLRLAFTGETENAKFNAIRVLDAQGRVVARIEAKDLLPPADLEALAVPKVKEPPIFRDPDQPQAARIEDLLRRLSLHEKAAQLVVKTPGIDRLGVLPYGYVNECLHGVADAGQATVFPLAIGNAATFDDALVGKMAESISTEARGKFSRFQSQHDYNNYHGLDFWTPNVNIFRDPRWGRGQETYGEDPFLTGTMGTAFVRGLQGDDLRYVRAMACAKHFAVHSGPEPGRGGFNMDPEDRDLHDTYLPQFQMLVQQGHVGVVMSSYNALYHVPASCSPWLLTGLLRDTWGFRGQVVSDCGAIENIPRNHHYVPTDEEAIALAIRAGCDMDCGTAYAMIPASVKRGLISVAEVDTAVRRNLKVRFDLGLFDPPERVPYTKIGMDVVECPAHLEQATQLARESMVLLRNERQTLPLDATRLKRLAVIGESANSADALLGDPNYQGTPSHPVTILEGIRHAVEPGVEVTYAKGCPLGLAAGEVYGEGSPGFQEAVSAAKSADAVIYVGGITGRMEHEEGGTDLVGFHAGDRTSIELPIHQTKLLQALHATGKPVIFVNCSGSAMAMPWEAANLPAILQAWYPGTNGGTAVADILFGKYNPAGRLPVTFYAATKDLPDYFSYRMANRTYRFFTGKPLYAFGHGLSYTAFRYGPVTPPASGTETGAAGTIRFQVPVTNTGARDGDEVVQVYARRLDGNPDAGRPLHTLVGFHRATLRRGETETFDFAVPVERMRLWDAQKKVYVVEPGRYELQIASASDDVRQTLPMVVR